MTGESAGCPVAAAGWLVWADAVVLELMSRTAGLELRTVGVPRTSLVMVALMVGCAVPLAPGPAQPTRPVPGSDIALTDLVAGRDQRLHPRAPVGLDPDHHPGLVGILTELRADHRVQTGHARHTLGQLRPAQHPPRFVLQLDIVVLFGPVITDEQQLALPSIAAITSAVSLREKRPAA